MRGLLYKIQRKSITSFAEGNMVDVATCRQCLSEKNLKHFAGSRIGSSGAYKRRAVLQRSTRVLQSIIKVGSWRLYNVYNQQDQKGALNNLVVDKA